MTADARRSFDLRSEPWLPVLTLDGRVQQLGILQVVERSAELRCLIGDLPTQAFAQLRLLEAVLHRAAHRAGVRGQRGWLDLWESRADLASLVGEYLDEHADRFDLLHPQTPFFQVAGLRTAKGTVSPLTTLIADVPNNEQFFSTRAGRGLRDVSLAEGARWLVHAHAYDPSGIKSGAEGDARVKGGRGYPIGVGWLGGIGGIFLEGRDLRETLLLNLVLSQPDGPAWAAGDSAVWERPAHGPGVEATERTPTGPADLLTWQSRRVLLRTAADRVTGVVIANGDRLARHTQRHTELMTGWRRSENQEKALKLPLVYMPLEHRPERALWRGLEAMLPGTEATTSTSGTPEQRTPAGVLRWVGGLVEDEALEAGHLLRIHAVGMTYGSNNSVVDDVIDDALPLVAVLLGEHGAELRQAAVLAVRVTDQAVRALGRLAENLAVAAGGAGQGAAGASDRALELAYADLDSAFRAWLLRLVPGQDPLELRSAWEATARRRLMDLGRQLMVTAGNPAWVGRDVRRRPEDPGRWVDSPLAWGWFLTALNVSLTTTAPQKEGAA